MPPSAPSNPYSQLDRGLAQLESAAETGATITRYSELLSVAKAEAKLLGVADDVCGRPAFRAMDESLRLLRTRSDDYEYAQRFLTRARHPERGHSKPSNEMLAGWLKEVEQYELALATFIEKPRAIRIHTSKLYADLAFSATNRADRR